jgi:hypothetical protein
MLCGIVEVSPYFLNTWTYIIFTVMLDILQQNNYRIIHLTDGNLMKEAIELINSNMADGINFNFTRNFPKSLNALVNAQNIKVIQINDYDLKAEYDYSIIQKLPTLEQLSILTTDKKEINYLDFPFLKHTALYWRPKARSLFQCEKLESLFIGRYIGQDLAEFSNLTSLTYLRINTGSVVTLKGIESLRKLERLWLMQATKLEDIAGIESLSNLKQLYIDNCKAIKNIEIVKQLPSNIRLTFTGTTPRLK